MVLYNVKDKFYILGIGGTREMRINVSWPLRVDVNEHASNEFTCFFIILSRPCKCVGVCVQYEKVWKVCVCVCVTWEGVCVWWDINKVNMILIKLHIQYSWTVVGERAVASCDVSCTLCTGCTTICLQIHYFWQFTCTKLSMSLTNTCLCLLTLRVHIWKTSMPQDSWLIVRRKFWQCSWLLAG